MTRSAAMADFDTNADCDDDSAVPLGDIGYTFCKLFTGYGLFDGTVVKIRPGAVGGRDRRCVYTDGDLEDLSLDELRELDRQAKQRRRKRPLTKHLEKVERNTKKRSQSKRNDEDQQISHTCVADTLRMKSDSTSHEKSHVSCLSISQGMEIEASKAPVKKSQPTARASRSVCKPASRSSGSITTSRQSLGEYPQRKKLPKEGPNENNHKSSEPLDRTIKMRNGTIIGFLQKYEDKKSQGRRESEDQQTTPIGEEDIFHMSSKSHLAPSSISQGVERKSSKTPMKQSSPSRPSRSIRTSRSSGSITKSCHVLGDDPERKELPKNAPIQQQSTDDCQRHSSSISSESLDASLKTRNGTRSRTLQKDREKKSQGRGDDVDQQITPVCVSDAFERNRGTSCSSQGVKMKSSKARVNHSSPITRSSRSVLTSPSSDSLTPSKTNLVEAREGQKLPKITPTQHQSTNESQIQNIRKSPDPLVATIKTRSGTSSRFLQKDAENAMGTGSKPSPTTSPVRAGSVIAPNSCDKKSGSKHDPESAIFTKPSRTETSPIIPATRSSGSLKPNAQKLPNKTTTKKPSPKRCPPTRNHRQLQTCNALSPGIAMPRDKAHSRDENLKMKIPGKTTLTDSLVFPFLQRPVHATKVSETTGPMNCSKKHNRSHKKRKRKLPLKENADDFQSWPTTEPQNTTFSSDNIKRTHSEIPKAKRKESCETGTRMKTRTKARATRVSIDYSSLFLSGDERAMEIAPNDEMSSDIGELCEAASQSIKVDKCTSSLLEFGNLHSSKPKFPSVTSADMFMPHEDMVPIDRAAEATLMQNTKSISSRNLELKTSIADEESDDKNTDIWLTKVAQLLGAGTESDAASVQTTSKVSSTLSSGIPSRRSSSTTDSKIDPTPSLAIFPELRSLRELKTGDRSGTFVFLVKDKKRVVGEVILEHPHGYVEAIINRKVEKERISSFAIAPKGCSISDKVSPLFPLPSAVSKNGANATSLCDKSAFVSTGKEKETSADMLRQSAPSHSPTLGTSHQRISDTSQSSLLSRRGRSLGVNAGRNQPNSNESVSMDNLFCWRCDTCTLINRFVASFCKACETKRCRRSLPSPLLKMAEAFISKANKVDEVVSFIPELHRGAIPQQIIRKMLAARGKSDPRSYPTPPTDLKTYYYWICAFCTMKMSFRRFKCDACGERKTNLCPSSLMLNIASKASVRSQTVDEARDLIAAECPWTVPDAVLNALVTCISMVGRNKNERRRCLRPKSSGADFCVYHCDPALNNKGKSGNILTRCNEIDDHPLSQQPETKGVANILSCLPEYLSNNVDVDMVNQLNWNIQSIEDALICQENNPFPLGMQSRRFFPGYGFHDGRIVKVHRKQFLDNETGIWRPVLVYRIEYNDGDKEDMIQFEIHSLRQIFDCCNIDSTASPMVQLKEGTLYECQGNTFAEITENITPKDATNSDEGGLTRIRIRKSGGPWTQVEVALTQLQYNVVRKLTSEKQILSLGENCSEGLKAKANHHLPVRPPTLAPVLEWPGLKNSVSDNILTISDEHEHNTSSGLSLHRSHSIRHINEREETWESTLASDAQCCIMNDDSCVRRGVRNSDEGWDPSNGSHYFSWDPFWNVLCNLCKIDKDDAQILICDQCHLGYHMYCVRPVIVNVPTCEWMCSRCSGDQDKGSNFYEIAKEVRDDLRSLSEFFGLQFEEMDKFVTINKYGLDIFSPTTHFSKRQAVLGQNKSKPTLKIGSLYFSRLSTRDWLLPLPLTNQDVYLSSLASIAASMKFCGMTSYAENLVYPVTGGVTEDMNDSSLENIEPLNQRNLDIFKDYKENLKRGAFPPINIVYDENVGFTVEALTNLPRHTLILEYTGEVTTVERSGETSSDSLMILLSTGDPATSLIIDPTKTGNAARFLSGINNRSNFSRRKANVRTRRFSLDGKCRVALFTSRKVESGDKLYYDYNAGIEGKTTVEWAKDGFYDTSNFF
eukprot:CAMPEP_0198287132 /NCGR_PEP_ID=MMETSP1449-20131203/6039_1 /TAXON_ID=420275 /ORGANISM="Attheya septentrionalis, Strain CCMP2084" /LENGTH=1964 /DNA_ID=CAMNT_0043985037 /DNA_START=184 /DNA_END=6078 /DNA_ORIENTATION=-